MNRTIIALAALLISAPALAGGIEIDAVTKSPSSSKESVYDRIGTAADSNQWDRWNSRRDADDRAAEHKRVQDRFERAQQNLERASENLDRWVRRNYR